MAGKKKAADFVTFQAKGKTWTLRLGARVWVEVENEIGLGMQECANEITQRGSFKVICHVFLAALHRQDDSLTMEDIYDIADEISDEVMLVKVAEALEQCFPTLKEEVGNAKKA